MPASHKCVLVMRVPNSLGSGVPTSKFSHLVIHACKLCAYYSPRHTHPPFASSAPSCMQTGPCAPTPFPPSPSSPLPSRPQVLLKPKCRTSIEMLACPLNRHWVSGFHTTPTSPPTRQPPARPAPHLPVGWSYSTSSSLMMLAWGDRRRSAWISRRLFTCGCVCVCVKEHKENIAHVCVCMCVRVIGCVRGRVCVRWRAGIGDRGVPSRQPWHTHSCSTPAKPSQASSRYYPRISSCGVSTRHTPCTAPL